MSNEKMAQLLRTLRRESNGLGLLGAELVLHCAERPRTVAELCHLTGAGNGQVNRALNRMAMHWDDDAAEVALPALHLITKHTRPEGRGFVYCLTSRGQALCQPTTADE